MKIYNAKNLNISKSQQKVIKSSIKDFNNKNYSNTSSTFFAPFRNKYGIPFHLIALLGCINYGISDLFDGQIGSAIFNALGAKLNYDFIPYINNINKMKAVQFQHYLTKKGLNDKNTLLYGVSKYLKKVGACHLPFFFPKETERIACQGLFEKTFETGIFAIRTDKKSLIYKLRNYLVKKIS